MSDQTRDRDPPNDCASPPCLMHEVDPAYMGLTPDTSSSAAPRTRPADKPQQVAGDGGRRSMPRKPSRPVGQ